MCHSQHRAKYAASTLETAKSGKPGLVANCSHGLPVVPVGLIAGDLGEMGALPDCGATRNCPERAVCGVLREQNHNASDIRFPGIGEGAALAWCFTKTSRVSTASRPCRRPVDPRFPRP